MIALVIPSLAVFGMFEYRSEDRNIDTELRTFTVVSFDIVYRVYSLACTVCLHNIIDLCICFTLA